MKTLIVSLYYAPEVGAAPSRITNMAEGLKDKGGDVEVLTALPNYPKGKIYEGYRGRYSMHRKINDVLVHRYWTFATITKNPILRLLSMFTFALTMWSFAIHRKRIKSFDNVIIQTPPIFVAFSAILIFRGLYRKKTILNISDLWPLSAVELGAVKEGSFVYKILAWMEKFMYRHTIAYQGQSREIVEHVLDFEKSKPHFLYRNLQHDVSVSIPKLQRAPFKIVYAGLLGVAQDILGIITQIDFKSMDAEFHIFGGGNQAKKIEDFISKNDTGVIYHGFLDKKDMVNELVNYHASIVPLAVRIKGAVPSKIFDLLPVGVPILFCGGGEGANIVNEYRIGYVSEPGNIDALKSNIVEMISLSDEEYQKLKDNCINTSKEDFSFTQQMSKYYEFLLSLN